MDKAGYCRMSTREYSVRDSRCTFTSYEQSAIMDRAGYSKKRIVNGRFCGSPWPEFEPGFSAYYIVIYLAKLMGNQIRFVSVDILRLKQEIVSRMTIVYTRSEVHLADTVTIS